MSHSHHFEDEDAEPASGRREKPIRPEDRERMEAQITTVLEEASVVASTRTKLAGLEKAVSRTETFAKWMDKRYLDPLIGLIPGAGDIPTAALGLYVVAEAMNAGVPKGKIFRMLVNLGIDLVGGAIPGIGDIFDFFYKANVKNAAIFRKYLEEARAEAGGVEEQTGLPKAA